MQTGRPPASGAPPLGLGAPRRQDAQHLWLHPSEPRGAPSPPPTRALPKLPGRAVLPPGSGQKSLDSASSEPTSCRRVSAVRGSRRGPREPIGAPAGRAHGDPSSLRAAGARPTPAPIRPPTPAPRLGSRAPSAPSPPLIPPTPCHACSPGEAARVPALARGAVASALPDGRGWGWGCPPGSAASRAGERQEGGGERRRLPPLAPPSSPLLSSPCGREGQK